MFTCGCAGTSQPAAWRASDTSQWLGAVTGGPGPDPELMGARDSLRPGSPATKVTRVLLEPGENTQTRGTP